MLHLLFPLGLGALVLILVSLDIRKTAKTESRLVNAHWLDEPRKFHMMTRWGAQY